MPSYCRSMANLTRLVWDVDLTRVLELASLVTQPNALEEEQPTLATEGLQFL